MYIKCGYYKLECVSEKWYMIVAKRKSRNVCTDLEERITYHPGIWLVSLIKDCS